MAEETKDKTVVIKTAEKKHSKFRLMCMALGLTSQSAGEAALDAWMKENAEAAREVLSEEEE